MMAVTRALCLATGGPQPSVQSASYNLKHNNYSAVAPAYLIIKASGNVPWACSLQKKIPKPCLRGSELYNWFSHGLLRAAKSQFQTKDPIWEDSESFSEFLRNSQNFWNFFKIFQNFRTFRKKMVCTQSIFWKQWLAVPGFAIKKDYLLVLQAQRSDSAVMQKAGPTETNLNSVRCMSTKNPTKRNERWE